VAIFERKYQRATFPQILNCVKYCQNKLNLRDWNIVVIEKSLNNEGAFGTTFVEAEGFTMQALIEIDSKMHKKENVNPYATVCHEMIHVLTMGKCHLSKEDNKCEEFIPRTFEDMLYVAYCEFANIKIMPVRKN